MKTVSVCVLVAAAAFSMSAFAQHDMMILKDANLKWGPIGSMQPGAQIAILEGDLSKAEPFTARLKFPAGFKVDPHTHPAIERVTPLKGTAYFGHGEKFDEANTTPVTVGDMTYMPANTPHYVFTKEETVLQLHGVGPWSVKYVNPNDDPRNKAKTQ